MGVSPKTLRNTVKLLEDGEVLDHKGDRLWLRPDIGVLVGVDVTHVGARVALSTIDFEPILDPEDPSLFSEIPIENPAESIKLIAELVSRVLNENLEEATIAQKLVGVGITLPGPILREPNTHSSEKGAAEWNRSVKAGPILPSWDEVDVGAELATSLMRKHGVRPPRWEDRRFVWMENDASAGALGVYTKLRMMLEDKSPEDVIFVRVSSGVGAGIVNKGHLVSGSRGFAGELGHVTVDPDGILCPTCGGRGCLETLVSNRAVATQLKEILELSSGLEALNFSKDVLGSDHPAISRAIADAGWHLGVTMAQVCALLNPAMIVVGGEMPEYSTSSSDTESSISRPFLNSMERAIRIYSTPQTIDRLRLATWGGITKQAHSMSPQLLGSLALVMDHLGDSFLMPPIEAWIRTPESRNGPVYFGETR